MNIKDFAVKLKIGDIERAEETMRGEFRRYIQRLEGRGDSDVELSDLIDKKNRIVFIPGLPGIGKSVLVKQLTYKWAKGTLFQEYKLCITFECRELNEFIINEGKRLEKHELVIEFLKLRFSFEFNSKDNVLFIVDGLDELYDINAEESIIWQLLDVKISNYPRAKLIITGRPHVENILFRQSKDAGGVRTVEIDGLSDKQIEEYIRKFASFDHEMILKINKARDSSKDNLKPINIPQILNSFCCVAILSEECKVHNEAELYCWSLYLLLKQHVEKDGSRDKRIPDIFTEYSKDLMVLGKICHILLNKNTIVFEGNTEFDCIDKGKEFLKGLFVDVSDDFCEKKQFKHLTLMEFLSAVYVCTIENPTEIIKDLLWKRLDQTLLFDCQLISGLMYDGIIREMFKSAANLQDINCYNFFCNILKLVRSYVKGLYDDDVEESFALSIDVIMCLMNKDVIKKQFLLAIINKLSFKNVGSIFSDKGTRKLIRMIKLLIQDFNCTDIELKKAFENVHFWEFIAIEFNELQYAKFLASADWVILYGIKKAKTTTVKDICKKIDEINEYVNCRKVTIWNRNLQYVDFEDEITESSKLELLQILSCNLNEQSFINLSNWIITSFVEEFQLHKIKDMKGEWWNILVDIIENAKEKNDGYLALKRLKIKDCSLMKDEIKKKVTTSILIHNYSCSMHT